MSTAEIVMACISVASLSIAVYAIRANKCKDTINATRTEATADTSLRADVRYTKYVVDEIRQEMRDGLKGLAASVKEHGEGIVRLDEAVKSAHNRLDEHLCRDHGKNIG